MANECPNLESCPFFLGKLSNKSAVDSIIKKNFCHGEKEDCARYYVASKLGKEFMPKDLHPLQWEIAEDLVEEKLLEVGNLQS